MRLFRFMILILAATLMLPSKVHSSTTVSDSAVYVVRFDVSSAVVSMEKYNNDTAIASFRIFWNQLQDESRFDVTGISFIGNASADGRYDFNKKLGDGRAKATAEYVSKIIGVDSELLHLDKAQWLKNDVAIAADLADGQMRDEMNRCCRIVINYVTYSPDSEQEVAKTEPAPGKIAEDTVNETATVESAVAETEETSVTMMPLKNPWTLKTNLLYDAVTVANLSLETGFCKHWAIDILAAFSPWDIKPTFKIRTLLLQPEVRYYLKKSAFIGHYFGIEGHLGWYNIALPDSPTRYQDCDGNTPLWGAGLTYGYVLPFGNPGTPASHWGMDFEIGVGYANLKYDCFYNTENGARYTTGSKDWFGPTKLGVSIYYRF